MSKNAGAVLALIEAMGYLTEEMDHASNQVAAFGNAARRANLSSNKTRKKKAKTTAAKLRKTKRQNARAARRKNRR